MSLRDTIVGRIVFGPPRRELLSRLVAPRPHFPVERAAVCGCGVVYVINGSCPACGSASTNSVMLSAIFAGVKKGR